MILKKSMKITLLSNVLQVIGKKWTFCSAQNMFF